MRDTEPKLAQCQKCNAYVFHCEVNGIRVMVDPAPAPDALAALTQGKCLYVGFKNGSGQLTRLQPMRTLAEGLYAQHACTVAGVVRGTPVEVAPERPQQAPVTPGGHQVGFRPGPAPVWRSQGRTAKITTGASSGSLPSRAKPVTHHLFKCEVCNQPIYGYERNIVAIHHGERIVWAEHVEH